MLLQLTTLLLISQVSSNSHAGFRKFPNNTVPIYIAGFFPTSPNVSEGSVGRGVLPSVKLALHHINMNPELLKEYMLYMSWNNTQCSAADGMKTFFDMMHEPPLKYMLFGDACTSVTDPIAKASKHWKIVQLSYADMHPMFSKKNFPNLYRIVPSENEFNEPRIELLKKFNWTRVGTLYQNKPRYSLAHNKLVADLEVMDIDVAATQSFSDDISYQMERLKEKDVRIILGNFNETWARRIFCEAYRQKLYGRKYQWLIVAAYTTHWWRKQDVNCTIDEVETALKGAILMDLNPLSTSQEMTVSGMTASRYEELYKIVNMGEFSRFHGYAYDGIWAIALALDNIGKYLPPNRRTTRGILKGFQYHNDQWEKAFLSALENTYFIGVTGPVRFRDNGRKGTVLIKQFQAFNTVNAEVKVGEFDGVTQQLNLAKGGDIVWNGIKPPKDRTIQIIEHTRVNLSLYAIMVVLASFGIILAGFFLGVNIKFRNQRYIKMSSPYLNNLIIIGCIFTYMSVMLLGLDSKLTSVDAFPYICAARAWVLMAGFSLAFGSMFSKTWRVHSIFTNVKLNKKVIKDMQLFLVVGILLTLDFAIMTSWHFIDPMYRNTKQMEPLAHQHNEDIEIIPLNEYCKSDYMSYFVGIIYAYKGLLMMFGCFLAWETRHVSIPALNDSKYIGMSVYNCVMMCVLGAPLSHVLSDQQDVGYFIISFFIIFCTTATLCLVFIPKVIELRRNPKGTVEKRLRPTLKPPFGVMSSTNTNQSYTHAPATTHSSSHRRGSATSIYDTELKTAKQHNIKIRKQIRDVDSEIVAIAKLLGKDDADVAKIMQEQSQTLPKSEVLKKEDTDVSSLYSLNSEGGELFMDDDDYDEDEDQDEEMPKKKYPGIVEGLAGLSMVNVPAWSNIVPKTIMPLTTEAPIPEIVKEEPELSSDIILEEKAIITKNRLHKSEYDLLNIFLEKSIRKSLSFDELRNKRDTIANSNKKVKTTQDDIWELMLKKEQSRYIGKNINNRNDKDKVLKIATGEIFINGKDSHDFQLQPTEEPLKTSNGKCISLGRIIEENDQNKQPCQSKLTSRSYSVPRRLDNSLTSSEINLDVSLLPIFHKILSDQRRSLRDRKTNKNAKKFMVSCPNILIKCDIVEYL